MTQLQDAEKFIKTEKTLLKAEYKIKELIDSLYQVACLDGWANKAYTQIEQAEQILKESVTNRYKFYALHDDSYSMQDMRDMYPAILTIEAHNNILDSVKQEEEANKNILDDLVKWANAFE